MATKPTILIFTTGEGHKSISDAITEILQTQYEIVTIHKPIIFHSGYKTIYRHFPGLFGWFHTLTQKVNTEPIQEMASEFSYYSEAEAAYLEHKPVAVISTYFAFLPALAKLERTYQVPVLNVVANPVTIHPLEISSEVSLNVVFDERAKYICQQFAPNARIEDWGWFVRTKFHATDKTQLRRKLNLKLDQPLLMISGGSEGTQKTYDIVEMIINEKLECQAVVVCGSNSSLRKKLEALLPQASKQTVVTVLGFSHNIHEYLAAADLFVTKAGPNSIFEAVACHIPQVIFTHIAGQETGNLDLINEYELGVVAEDVNNAVNSIKYFLAHGQLGHAPNTALAAKINKTPEQLKKWVGSLPKQN